MKLSATNEIDRVKKSIECFYSPDKSQRELAWSAFCQCGASISSKTLGNGNTAKSRRGTANDISLQNWLQSMQGKKAQRKAVYDLLDGNIINSEKIKEILIAICEGFDALFQNWCEIGAIPNSKIADFTAVCALLKKNIESIEKVKSIICDVSEAFDYERDPNIGDIYDSFAASMPQCESRPFAIETGKTMQKLHLLLSPALPHSEHIIARIFSAFYGEMNRPEDIKKMLLR